MIAEMVWLKNSVGLGWAMLCDSKSWASLAWAMLCDDNSSAGSTWRMLRDNIITWLSDDRWVWFNYWIYWIVLQLVTTFYKSRSYTDYCHQSCCLVMAFIGGRSSASGLTSLQAGDHLTPTTYSDCWLQLLLPSPLSSQFQPRIPTHSWLLINLSTDGTENTASNICSIVPCYFVAAGTVCLHSWSLATAVSAVFTILAFTRHATLIQYSETSLIRNSR
jgi:hypothetical protein